jgi:hypothetical protein
MVHETMAAVEALIPRNQTTYMFLGEHTQKDAYRILSNYDNAVAGPLDTTTSSGFGSPYSGIRAVHGVRIGDPDSFHLTHVYPVLPMEYVIDPPDSGTEYGTAEANVYHPLFAMQGNFGGKHAHRKDPKGTVNCLKRIEDKILRGVIHFNGLRLSSGGSGGGGGGGNSSSTVVAPSVQRYRRQLRHTADKKHSIRPPPGATDRTTIMHEPRVLLDRGLANKNEQQPLEENKMPAAKTAGSAPVLPSTAVKPSEPVPVSASTPTATPLSKSASAASTASVKTTPTSGIVSVKSTPTSSMSSRLMPLSASILVLADQESPSSRINLTTSSTPAAADDSSSLLRSAATTTTDSGAGAGAKKRQQQYGGGEPTDTGTGTTNTSTNTITRIGNKFASTLAAISSATEAVIASSHSAFGKRSTKDYHHDWKNSSVNSTTTASSLLRSAAAAGGGGVADERNQQHSIRDAHDDWRHSISDTLTTASTRIGNKFTNTLAAISSATEAVLASSHSAFGKRSTKNYQDWKSSINSSTTTTSKLQQEQQEGADSRREQKLRSSRNDAKAYNTNVSSISASSVPGDRASSTYTSRGNNKDVAAASVARQIIEEAPTTTAAITNSAHSSTTGSSSALVASNLAAATAAGAPVVGINAAVATAATGHIIGGENGPLTSTKSLDSSSGNTKAHTASTTKQGTTSSASTKSHSNGHSGGVSISIDLVGHLNGEVQVGTLKTGEVRFLSDLRSRDYYEALSRARFMLAAIGEKEYLTSRATSSVPAALIAHVPLVTSGEFLSIYPCLRDAPMHRWIAGWVPPESYNKLNNSSSGITGDKSGSSNSISAKNKGLSTTTSARSRKLKGTSGNEISSASSSKGDKGTTNNKFNSNNNVNDKSVGISLGSSAVPWRSECEAMEIAVQLTEEQYAAAKAEITYCANMLWEQGKESYRNIIARSQSASKKTRYIDIKHA